MKGATRALALIAAILAVAPSAWAQEADGSHRVRTGDTLWGLAAQYLSDPFRWPELYELNVRVVEDPHWIYPGETLLLPAGVRATGEPGDRSRAPRPPDQRVARTDGDRGEPREQAGDVSRSFGPAGQYPEGSVFRADPRAHAYGELSIEQREPSAVVSESDFYGAAILADRSSFVASGTTARVVAEAHPSIKLPRTAGMNDEVVLHLSAGAVAAGDHLRAVRWGRSLGDAGDVLYTVGLVRVTRTYPSPDSVRAVVVRLFGDYRVGDSVVQAEEYPLTPGETAEPEENGLVGTVLGFAEDQVLLATSETLFLDSGSDDGVMVGDVFAVFPGTSTAETALFEDRLTTVRVIHASPATSTARVTEVRDAGMRPGAPVRRVERMPR